MKTPALKLTNPVATKVTEEDVMKEIAWMFKPIDLYRDTAELAKNLGFTLKRTKDWLTKLTNENKLLSPIPPRGAKRYYSIPKEEQVRLLTQMLDEDKWKKRPVEFLRENYMTWRAAVRAYVCGYLQANPVKKLRILDFEPTLVPYMLVNEKWSGLCQYFDFDCLMEAFHDEHAKCVENLSKPNEVLVKNGFLENKNLAPSFRAQVRCCLLIEEALLPAKFNLLDNPLLPADNDFLLGCKAVADFYKGKDKAALKIFLKMFKSGKSVLLGIPVVDFYYMLSLLAEGSAGSIKVLRNLAYQMSGSGKRKERYPFLFILSRLADNEDTTLMVRNFFENLENGCLSPDSIALTALVIHHFHLDKDIDCDYSQVVNMVDADHLKLLQLEYSVDFEPFKSKAQQLQQETGLTPLLQRIRVKEKWENALEALKKIVPDKEKKGKEKDPDIPRSRIAYLVDDQLAITPRLQKSKDGQNWTGGRNMALSTFSKGTADMDERALRVATYVKRDTYGWYSQVEWTLGGVKAVACLVDYPFVFSADNPAVPITITKEEPQISVLRRGKGLRITDNLEGAFYDGNIFLKQETNVLWHVIELTKEQKALFAVLNENDEFPEEAIDEVVALLPLLSEKVTVHSDLLAKTDLPTVKGDTQITFLLQPYGDGVKAEMYVKPLVSTPPYCRPGQGNASVIGTADGKKVLVKRSLNKELAARKQAEEWLEALADDLDDQAYLLDTPDKALQLLDILRQHTDTLRSEWPKGVKMRIAAQANMSNFNLRVGGAGQWFDVEGEVKIDDNTTLKMGALLALVRQSRGRFVEIDEGTYIALSDTLRKRLRNLDAAITERRGKMKLPAFALSVVETLKQDGAQTETNKAAQELMAKMEAADKQSYPVPTQLKAELRPYQVDGFQWMARLAAWGAGACLADDMGLGKTVQTIALLLSRAKQGPSLVVAPASVVPNWKAELQRFAPSLTPLMLNEADDRQAIISQANNFDVVVATYGLLIRETEALSGKQWNVIALDEAHTIKNKDTKISKAAMQLNSQARVMLTGTPLQNHLVEIWNLFQFAVPGLLGGYESFNDKFVNSIERDHNKDQQKQLKRLLQPFILRRKKNDVLDELPEKTEITMRVELSEQEMGLYESLRKQAELGLESGSLNAMTALAEISKLRQAACNPRLIDPKLNLPSAKMEALLQLVNNLMGAGHRALVFSQFTSHLALVREELDKAGINYLYLDGATPIGERQRIVKAYQTGDAPLFLISLKAGGLGLNLTAADYVIHLDPWWNPAIEDQASDRAYRIGQARAVTIYRLIAAHTIEEKIIRLHTTKKSMADTLLEGSDMAHRLGKDEIMELLKNE